MGRIRLYAAASLDGRIADGDGGVAWLDAFDTPETGDGYRDFIRGIGTVVMGRTTFDQVLGFDVPWPYAGLRTRVLTSRPLDEPPPEVEALPPARLEAAIEEARAADRDTWLVGGGRTVAAFLERDAVDGIELHVMPVLLGAGPLLFPGGSATDFACRDARVLPKGIVKLRYERREHRRPELRS